MIELIDFQIITDTSVCFIAPYLYICIFFWINFVVIYN